MFFIICWCSPGLVVFMLTCIKWYKGNNIIYTDIKLIGMMSVLGIFIPTLQRNILAIDDNRIFIYGRKNKRIG